MTVNLPAVMISGAFGGVCAATISDTSRDIETGRKFSSKERALQFLSRTILATISAVAAHALAYYIKTNLVLGAALLGFALYAFSHPNPPESDLSHRITAKVLAIVSGVVFSAFPWNRLYP